MPRQVDYGQRREKVIAAVFRLADRHGLEGVTLRDAAREAGMSMGAVQRCFRTKDEILTAALTHVSEQFTARARAAVGTEPDSGTRDGEGVRAGDDARDDEGERDGTRTGARAGAGGRGGVGGRSSGRARSSGRPAPGVLRRLTADLALLDPAQRPEAQVWLAFVARAAVTPALAEILRDAHPRVLELVTRLIRTTADSGRGTADPELEARTLLALADGLTVQVLLGQIEQDEAHRILDAHVGRLSAP